MTNEEIAINKYINDKKELQQLVLKIVDHSKIDDEQDFQNLINFINTHKSEVNKPDIEHFLRLISIISMNHHREPNFFQKIEKILTISSNIYKSVISNGELFIIFKQNKPILLYLLKSKIVTIDEIIFNYLLNFNESKENGIYYYFYPELNEFIKSGTINQINEYYEIKLNEYIENFEINRQIYENDSTICSLIRKDLIEDFIQYYHKTNISLSSQIKRSIFETNPIFIEKEPTLIEYAAFYGSIQIFQYLAMNNVELTPTLWLYAIHSNNPEVIQFLKDKKIEMDDRTFSEAIKCHHNEIAHYIYDNLPLNSANALLEESMPIIYSSFNYEFFPYQMKGNKIFYSLCKNEYTELVSLYFSQNRIEIEDYICKKDALRDNKIDAVYYLLSIYDRINRDYFSHITKATQIAIPPSIYTIESNAFANCTNLTTVSLPSSVTKIRECAFDKCSSLVEVTNLSSLNTIGQYAFRDCKSLKQLTIPSSLSSIKGCSFAGCSKLEMISIVPCNDKRILYFENKFLVFKSTPKVEFYDTLLWVNPTLEIANIPKFVKKIDEKAFSGCTSLKCVTIPSSIMADPGYLGIPANVTIQEI